MEFCWLLYWPLWKCRKSDLNSNTKHSVDILESPFPWLALFSFTGEFLFANLNVSSFGWILGTQTYHAASGKHGKPFSLPPQSYPGLRNICYHLFSDRVFDGFIFLLRLGYSQLSKIFSIKKSSQIRDDKLLNLRCYQS